MSFVFPSWETAFSPAFHESAKAMLEGALNKVSHTTLMQLDPMVLIHRAINLQSFRGGLR
jgi:hypothetical protein